MSHYAVLVIGENPEKQLKPFDENIEMPKYVEYTKKQLIEKGKKEIKDYNNNTYKKYLTNKEKYKSTCSNDNHIKYLEKDFPKKLKWSDDEIYKHEIRWYDKKDIGKNGEVYSTYNPKSKWDWYQLGGRWTGAFKLKKNKNGNIGRPGLMTKSPKDGFCDQAKKKDIDFSLNQKEYKKSLRFWELKIEKQKPKNKKEEEIIKFDWYKDEYYIEKFGTKENYAKLQSEFSTYAVLKDGKWYESGKMGWFGCSSASAKEQGNFKQNFYDRFIKDLDNNTLLSVYDCHI